MQNHTTVELTAKKYKFQIALANFLMSLCLVMIVAGLLQYNEKMGLALMTIGGTLGLAGAIWYFWVKFLIWWNHK